MKRNPAALHDDAFARLEHEQLLAWARLSTRAKIEFFEEMVELAWRSGALRPDRLALRDAPAGGPG